MTEQLSLFPDPSPAPATALPEAEPAGAPKETKRKLRFLTLDDPQRPRNRVKRQT
jgi:hypothetical protein